MTPEYRDRVRERLARRIRILPMPPDPVPTPAPQTTEERIAEEAACRHAALVRRARDQRMQVVPDPGHPGRYITRPRITGNPWRPASSYVNLTTTTSCTCPHFRTWHRCPCQALVIETIAASDRARITERTAA